MSRSFRIAAGSVLITLILAALSFAYEQIECVREIGEAGKKAKERIMNSPRAIAVSGDLLYIADTDAHRVLVLNREGQTVQTWGAKGDEPGRFKSPAGISIDEQGRVYVADTGNHRIQVFDANGALVRVIGAKGCGPREFKTPSGIVVRRGFLYVADKGNSRVQMLTDDGIFIREITWKNEKDEMKAPVAVAVDVQNRIYALDPDTYRVRVFGHDGSQIFSFGIKGRGTEGLDEPQGLAVDAYGNIYVADTGNYKLKKFDPKGTLVASLGSKGDGPGQFREPAGMAVDANGKVFVLDAGKHTLQQFACERGDAKPLAPLSPPAGVSFLKELPGEMTALAAHNGLWQLSADSVVTADPAVRFGSRGSKPGLLKKPRGLSVDSSGNIWVADTGNDRLQKFSPGGEPLQVIGKSGSGEGAFDSPSAVAIGSKGNIYVADTGNKRIQVFHPKGAFLGVIGKAGKLPGQFAEPVDIALDSSEHVYVVDRGYDRIAKFDGNGALVWETGRNGRGDGEFDKPTNILISPDSEVFVLDAGNARVQVFDMNGKFLRKFGSEGAHPGEFKSPQGLALEGGLHLSVGDRGNNRVQVFQLRQTPVIPRDVSAQARPNEVRLAWHNGAESYLEGYRVYRSEGGDGPFTLAGTSTGTATEYVDAGLPSGKTFRYRIASVAKEGNESAPSAEVSAETPRLIPAQPQKMKIEAAEKQITLIWPANVEPFLDHYNVYRSLQPSAGFELLARADKTVFVDKPLADETMYYYQVSAVGKEGDESPRSEPVFATTPKEAPKVPPLEIVSVDVGGIFSSAYKYYESHPIGKVFIKNNTETDFPKVKVNFSIKDFMDFPTEINLEQVPAGKQLELELRPVFSNKILEVTENTPLQTELAITYYVQGEQKRVTRSLTMTLYERHAMVWDRLEKLGAFVTPKDPPVADFSRAVIQQYVDAYPGLPQALVYGRALYDALGVLGMKYIASPTSHRHDDAATAAVVDYLQYPRDTLTRMSGDCSDLTTLFAACMEDIGIETAFADVPGHVFVLFNTRVSEKEKASLGYPDELVVTQDGFVWIPVEMTMVGSSFTEAWKKGAEEYRDWTAKGKLTFVNIENSWGQFKPVTLPHTAAAPLKVSRDAIEAMFKDEMDALARQRLTHLSAEYLDALKKKPDDVATLGKLGILYGENGLYAEALTQFRRITEADGGNAMALTNIGNIYFLQDRLEDARASYEAALRSEPGDTGIQANLARVLLSMGKKKDAKKLFQDAAEKDPRVVRKYGDLAADLGIVK